MPAVAASEKPSWTNRRATATPAGLSRSAREKNTVPRCRQLVPRRGLALGEGQPEAAVDAHDLAGGAHLRSEQGVGVGEAGEGQHRLLHAHVPPRSRAGAAGPRSRSSARVAPGHHPGRHLGQRHAGRLRHERHGPAGPRVGLDHEHLGPSAGRRVLDRELHVERADRPRGRRRWPGCSARSPRRSPGSRVGGGMTQALSPEWTPASSTCSITAPITTSPVASRTASTSTSMASSRKRSTSTGPLGRQASLPAQRAEPGQLGHGPPQVFLVVDDLHGPARRARSSGAPGPDSRSAPRWPGPPRR